jgi:GNAT superfamily N-acetyltransferase
MVGRMNLEQKFYSFLMYDDISPDEKALSILAQLAHEFWSEMEYPHRSLPISIYKYRIANSTTSEEHPLNIMLLGINSTPIGYTTIFVKTGKSNRTVAWCLMFIKVEYRKQGFMKVLLKEALNHIPDYVKLLRFFFRVDQNQKNPGDKLTFESKLADLTPILKINHSSNSRRSDLDLTKVDKEKITINSKKLLNDAYNNGFSFYFTDTINFTNLPFNRELFIKLIFDFNNDAPRDNSTREDDILNEEEFLKMYQHAKIEKMTYWICIAVDDSNNLPIAMTETRFWADIPEWALVENTGVKREYRGKKLGLTLKTLMLEKLLTDSTSKDVVKTWITGNAQSNTFMIAINDELGYQQSTIQRQYEIPVENLKSYLN